MANRILELSEDHIYTVGGTVALPSTTQIINPDHSHVDPWYRDRGKALHKAVELYLNGDLDFNSVDDAIAGYLQAAINFLTTRQMPGIFDFKTGKREAWHELQLASYVELWLNGVDEYGQPMRALCEGSEVKAFHPIHMYAGTIDYINLTPEFTGIPKAYTVHLQASGNYYLAEAGWLRAAISEFITLASAGRVRAKYKI